MAAGIPASGFTRQQADHGLETTTGMIGAPRPGWTLAGRTDFIDQMDRTDPAHSLGRQWPAYREPPGPGAGYPAHMSVTLFPEQSKYPPAKPGALVCEPLKAA